ncbi:MAG: hypothetical protein ACYCS1_05405 [Gammaproteobacteria bacterium]
METIQISVYEFDELEDSVKEKLIERERRRKEDYDNLDIIEESLTFLAEEKFEEAGIKWEKKDKRVPVPFDMYGEGYANPTGEFELTDEKLKPIDAIAKMMSNNEDEEVKPDGWRIWLYTEEERDYIKAYLSDSEGNEYRNNDELPPEIENIGNRLRDTYNNICKILLKSAIDEYEFMFSDECIIEDIKSQDMRFLKDGTEYFQTEGDKVIDTTKQKRIAQPQENKLLVN